MPAPGRSFGWGRFSLVQDWVFQPPDRGTWGRWPSPACTTVESSDITSQLRTFLLATGALVRVSDSAPARYKVVSTFSDFVELTERLIVPVVPFPERDAALRHTHSAERAELTTRGDTAIEMIAAAYWNELDAF
ncbi:hypothetical protein DHEL01_v206072 [Diaporthe helianthi]|uniref:Uncharacterized protein n=1 Tax=Diaporthe helianthi TaxID=158607 RepID=A0A2P5HZ42_DIAHE|nr:hypothetical protein DHEL01_v206072 [Diaporthe helianthi]